MNLDFKKLDRTNQIKAINEVLSQDNADYLAHLIQTDKMDVYSWFDFSRSKDGIDYWIDLKDKVNKE